MINVYRDLFNAAFMSVWTELSEEMQNNLTDSLYEALKTSDHSEIIQTILNLAEFMDHSEKVIIFGYLLDRRPISIV